MTRTMWIGATLMQLTLAGCGTSDSGGKPAPGTAAAPKVVASPHAAGDKGCLRVVPKTSIGTIALGAALADLEKQLGKAIPGPGGPPSYRFGATTVVVGDDGKVTSIETGDPAACLPDGRALSALSLAAAPFPSCKKAELEGGSGWDCDEVGVHVMWSGPNLTNPVFQIRTAGGAISGVASEAGLRAFEPQLVAALDALGKGDPAPLAAMIHPVRGVRLAATPQIDAAAVGLALKPAEFVAAFKDARPRNWGSEEGSGEPISLSVKQYVARFIDGPLKRARKGGAPALLNRRAEGEHAGNLDAAFPGAAFYDFYAVGTEKNGGLDWTSVIVVVDPVAGKPQVLGILADAWIP